MTVLVVGSGGREHALARAINADPAVTTVHVAPGNPGTATFATNHAIDPLDGDAVAALAVELGADLVVVGPEAPLVAGVADAVRAAGIACFGPSREAAQLEGSKAFAKQVMDEAGVPTAASRVCRTPDEAAAALDEFAAPHVVKDDGLAAGKGVVLTLEREVALAHAAGCDQVVIEEFLDGPEVSLFVITDGTTALAMQPAQDFKRVGDGDLGPNTGGMGAYSPLPWAPDDIADQVLNTVALPTLQRMAERGTPFAGLLYCGLALTSKGLRVIEFNARFGDPETQVLLALLDSPLGQVLHAAATGRLAEIGDLRWRDGAAVGVVVAAEGYPDKPTNGASIVLPEDTDRAWTIHAGTAVADQTLVAAGGRVLTVVGRGDSLAGARAAAYAHLERIEFPSGFHRRDIAAVAAEQESNR
ncbi:phosphoribosylamine--glycine ligase [Aestuariimicrobium ganziense]|uniref:phosphoribosylamine--glycine ligase n=1 Tax=Aestuariimicrobium ganziense TaxID=2773677 RepID=UPI0019447687|nr:phosphoribosylamine--glycine ligase [Aestuariimicrobium ganziense]